MMQTAEEGCARHTPPLRRADAARRRNGTRRQLERGAERASVSGNPLHAPGLAPLTGFSRSSDPFHNERLGMWVPNRHFGWIAACRGLEAWYLLSGKVPTSPSRRPLVQSPDQRPLHARGLVRR